MVRVLRTDNFMSRLGSSIMSASIPDISGFMKPAQVPSNPAATEDGSDAESVISSASETASELSGSGTDADAPTSAQVLPAPIADPLPPRHANRVPPPPFFRRGSSSSASGDSGRSSSNRSRTARKLELLDQIHRFEQRGLGVRRKFTMQDSVEDMEEEVKRIETQRNVDGSIKFQRKILMALVTGVEFLNTRYDPFGVHLEGWSESLYDGMNEYDDVFEELYMKYRGKSKLPPEVRLVMMVAGSGFMFHLTNTMFRTSSIPGVDQVMRQNPDLMKQFAGAAANMMASSGQDATGMAGLFGNMFPKPAAAAAAPPQVPAPSTAAPPPRMRGPTDMGAILQTLQPSAAEAFSQAPGARKPSDQISIVTESDISDLLDMDAVGRSSVGSGAGGSRRGRKAPGSRTLTI